MSAQPHPVKVRVDHNSGGDWEVALPDRAEPITLATLEEAQRVAYLCATLRRPCELILCDAYRRPGLTNFVTLDSRNLAASI